MTGAERIQAHAKKRKEDQERDRPKPAVVSTEERADRLNRAALNIRRRRCWKIQMREQSSRGKRCQLFEAKAKPKVSPQQVKRPGGLSIASGPPSTKAKPSPTQGLKRTAEEGTGDLESEPPLSKRLLQPQHQQRRVHQTQAHKI